MHNLVRSKSCTHQVTRFPNSIPSALSRVSPNPLWKRKPDPVRTPLASKHYGQPRGKCGATLLSSLPIFKIFYRNHAARTAEIAVGELSPTVADAPTSHRVRFAVAVGVGGGVSDSCYPCSGHYSNTYQPRLRWCTDTPRWSCTRYPGRSRRLPPRSGTRRTAMPRRRRLRGSTASSEVVPDHLAPQPQGRATGTHSPVVPCKTKMTVTDADARPDAATLEDLRRRMFVN